MVDGLARGQVTVRNQYSTKEEDLRRTKSALYARQMFPPSLEQLLAISTYDFTLLTRTFVELDGPMCELLNEVWSFQPQHYACTQVLAGLIVLNTRNGQAVINNTVEVYGRKQSLKRAHGRFIKRKP